MTLKEKTEMRIACPVCDVLVTVMKYRNSNGKNMELVGCKNGASNRWCVEIKGPCELSLDHGERVVELYHAYDIRAEDLGIK